MKNNSINLDSALCFLFVSFAILGYKISYFDLQIFVPCVILIATSISGKKILFNKDILSICGLTAALLVYQSFLQIIVADFDLDSLLRLLRALIFCILMAAVVGSNSFSSIEIKNSIFITLLFHAITINLAATVPSVNEFFSQLSENDRVRPFRASGLLAGFDMAGLLCIIGTTMLLSRTYRPRIAANYVLYLLIFAVGCYFTSRVTLGLLFVIYIAYFIPFLFRERSIIKRFLISMLAGVLLVYVFQKYFLPIIDVTFSLGYFNVDRDLREEIVSRHAVQNTDSFLWSDMIFFPTNFWEICFGTGVDAPSDVGYIKDVFRYGLLGVGLSFVIYFKIYRIGIRGARINKRETYLSMIKMSFLLILLLTFKNNYFFTRTIFPLIFLLVCSAVMGRFNSMGRKISMG